VHDGGASEAALLEVAGEALEVGTARLEQTKVVLLAPGDELAKVQCVGVARQPAPCRPRRRERELLSIAERGIDDRNGGRWGRWVHVSPPDPAETRRPEHQAQHQVEGANVRAICRVQLADPSLPRTPPTAESVPLARLMCRGGVRIAQSGAIDVGTRRRRTRRRVLDKPLSMLESSTHDRGTDA
jgi:hypothetical protein